MGRENGRTRWMMLEGVETVRQNTACLNGADTLRGVSWFDSPAASYNTVQVKSTGGMFKFSHRAGTLR